MKMQVTGLQPVYPTSSHFTLGQWCATVFKAKGVLNHNTNIFSVHPVLVLRHSYVPEKVNVNKKSYSHQKYGVSVIESSAASQWALNRNRQRKRRGVKQQKGVKKVGVLILRVTEGSTYHLGKG
jgi:hypothetical protein